MSRSDSDRDVRQYLLVGTNRVGKSTLARDFGNKKISNGGRVLVITKHRQEWLDIETVNIKKFKELNTFTGIRKSMITDNDDFKYLLNFNNGLLILDDAKRFIDTRIDDKIEELQISRGQHMIDIMVIAHSFFRIPVGFFSYATHLIIKKTIESAIKRKNELYSYIDIVLETEKRVNQIAQKNQYYYEIITL